MKNPLVSIIVITYNSAKYVLETLESAKNQNYQNIELIISDDGSVDNTVKVCENWIVLNKNRFINSKIITVEKNTGIPSNCNRGLNAANGEWIKLIAGDDVLMENCIEDNILFSDTNEEIQLIQSQSKYYYDDFEKNNFIAVAPENNPFFFEEAGIQYQLLKKRNILVAPSVFFKRTVFKSYGGFDEDFKLIEDFTMWLKLTRFGVKIYFLEKVTVKYRVHRFSVSSGGKVNINKNFCKEQLLILKKYFDNEKYNFKIIGNKLKFRLLIMYDRIGLNNSSLFSTYLYKITWKLLT